MANAIHTESLCKRFGRVEALAQLNVQVPEGAIYALVGPNGAGKTTAIKLLMNVFAPTSGTATVLGLPSTQVEGRAFEQIGYVSENQELPDWMTVGGFLKYLRRFYPTWDTALEKELVAQFDLQLDRKLRQLSRGMRMKAALAGSLAYHPRLIVLDEPFTGLDPLVRDELIEGLLERAPESTTFISSHDLAEIESFASHVGYLEQGRLRFSEEMAALTSRFREVELTFAAPASLAASLPASWLRPEASASVVRFTDSGFDEQESVRQIRGAFPAANNISFTPMSLRSIFLALAKADRGAKASTA